MIASARCVKKPPYTVELEDVLQRARGKVSRCESGCVNTLHILMAIVENRQLPIVRTLDRHHVSLPNLVSEVTMLEERMGIEDPFDSRSVQSAQSLAHLLARSFDHMFVRTEHLVFAILSTPHSAAFQSLLDLDIHIPELRSALIVDLKSNGTDTNSERAISRTQPTFVEIRDGIRTNKAIEDLAVTSPHLVPAAVGLEYALLSKEGGDLDFVRAQNAFRALVAGL